MAGILTPIPPTSFPAEMITGIRSSDNFIASPKNLKITPLHFLNASKHRTHYLALGVVIISINLETVTFSTAIFPPAQARPHFQLSLRESTLSSPA